MQWKLTLIFHTLVRGIPMVRRFQLVREENDIINPPGIVAEGVVFNSGKVALCWSSYPHGIEMHDSIADILFVQSRNNVTLLQWIDSEDEVSPKAVSPKSAKDLMRVKEELRALASGSHQVLRARESSSAYEFTGSKR